MTSALLVIDLQNDYFPSGKFPLWNTEQTLVNVESAIQKANAKNMPVILIQHLAHTETGAFFNKGMTGADIHPRILAIAPNAKIVTKEFADSFYGTELERVLRDYNIDELIICGMMTQNCVTHTAISKSAEKYKVSILSDCCTTVNQAIHNIALRAVSTRIPLITLDTI